MLNCHKTLLLLLLCFSISGCGQSEYVPVRGKVTLGGKPLTTGTVTFINTAGGSIGYGSIQSDGTFSVSTGKQAGLKPGEYKASVVATAATEPKTSDQTEPVPTLVTPTKYADTETSGLKYQIALPGNDIEISL